MLKTESCQRLVILGRPNVGKSALFNRISGRRRALVGNEPGMTRDRLYAPAEWRGKHFEVIDTGGLALDEKDSMASEIFNQARVAMEEAGQLVLVVDAQAGVTALDEQLASLLRRTGKPLSLAVNKVDTLRSQPLLAEFYRLGIPDIFAVSAEHGLGVDDLLDHATRDFDAAEEGAPEQAEPTINVAIIGRPNVGKSTLLNRLLGEERSIVTPVAGTTRDAVDAEFETEGRRFRLIDTAGIRRKGKTRLMAEKLSVIQARKHLERSDVALLVLDAEEGVTALDTHIGGYAHESGRSVILVVNKWDVVKKGPSTTQDCTRIIRERMKFLDYAPIVFLSALKGQRVVKLPGVIIAAAEARRQRVSTAEMNRFLETLNFDRAPSPSGKPLRLYYLTQAGSAPPTFVAFTNRPGPLYFSVERYLENRIRERFGFAGTPLVIKARLKR
ncbi:MAG TPA: ribosome biogenesis GTPase Der [Terriglobia bacterium]|nr:ribosome biogenesis GTPase Der [Terriglobia bacterium]